MMLRLKKELYDKVLRGEKTATIRFGWLACRGALWLSAGRRSRQVELIRVWRGRVQDLADSDCRAAAGVSKDEILVALRRFYPTVTAKSPVTVVEFRL